jgi:glycosyltransferase involved in cell wall biosynthesis
LIIQGRRTQANGRNIGIRNAEGKVILIVDGHVYAHGKFMSTSLIKALDNTIIEIAGV